MTSQPVQYHHFRSPTTGVVAEMAIREDTIDFDLAMSSIGEDEYTIASEGPLTGWAIDIGTSIAPVAVALALANPELRVLALDVVPENIEIARLNVQRNGLADRVTILHRAAGGPDEASRVCWMRHRSHPAAETAYVNKHRYIGNSFWSVAHGGGIDSESVEMPVNDLGSLMDEYGIGEVAFLKIDCEGCEWAVLDSPAVDRVKYIIGEYHWDYIGQRRESTLRDGTALPAWAESPEAELNRLLGATHRLEIAGHPTIGHFRAWRQ